MPEHGTSRITAARERAFAAKQRLAIAATASFVVIAGLAWVSHPGKSSTSSASSSNTTDDQSGAYFDEERNDDDFGGFDSFNAIAPSTGAAPQVQTSVS